ncbi:chemotaxis response regulator protein-glutamate methylesterase [Marivirga sp. S37H4]|uniref:Protein-glutamate methylesterase/protein-glutamine glutaminase n=1 Tax=Marivirga aurantiaca TaxID=2802615 RepID=A0A934WXA9_9BACT|nr:chemotaxis response regulator protein-glutamate methylesterase [Marivirga aurantiaca]MBK6264556.1 chemotaxis response regulator protein-glutamate methylesterase [Marivirga aurantiaca]
MKNKKVLIIDDSAIVRSALTMLIEEEPGLEVMATAADPFFAAQKIKREIPDVITLDIEMPRMDGITFLKTLMAQYPIPVVIVSSLTQMGSETAIQALQYGAVEIITKPKMYGLGEEVEENRLRLVQAIKSASHAKVKRRSINGTRHKPLKVEPKYSADAVISKISPKSMVKTTEKIVLIGASTGGTEALRSILCKLPADSPGIAIVQHMPEHFTRSFAESLDKVCKVRVQEAKNGDTIVRGNVLIAPGNKHMLVKRSGARYYVEIKDGPLVNRHRPSVDVLFRSAANYVGANCKGILLTGMGADGARGLLEMKNNGAFTVAQDEKSCIVFGMPKEAIALDAVSKVCSLEEINSCIF